MEMGNTEELKIRFKLYKAVNKALTNLSETNQTLNTKNKLPLESQVVGSDAGKLSDIDKHLKKETADVIAIFNDECNMGKLTKFI
ncbi:hypothetical protein HK096_001435, partial [Nowakowskiella sp. JEL0078]